MAEIKDPTAAITDKRFQEPLAILRSGREKEAGKAQELARAEGAVETEKQRVAEIESGLQTAAAEKEAGAVREARDIYQEKLGKEPLPEFVPTQDNVQSIASLFSLIGVMGMVAGKGDAMRAMHAMNGMLEGHQKGRADLYKQEKATFEKNFNAMVKKHEEFRKEMEDAVKTAATDRELGYQKARNAAVKAGSNVVKAMIEKFGVAKAYESLIADNKSVEKAYELYRQEKQAAAQREATLEAARIRAGGKGLSKENQKAVGSNLNLMSDLSDLSRMVDKVKDEAAVFGLAGYLPQFLTQRAQSPEARQTLSLLQNITSKELKLRSGATVTVAEFARQRGFLPLETDSTEAIQDKITGLFDAIESETNGIAKRTNSSEIRSAVSEIPLPLSPSFRKETGGEATAPTSKANFEEERSRAKAAIAAGKDENAVRARFKERTGQEL